MAKSKWYVVWKGRQTGIFTTWDECAAQVNGFNGAQFKSFESRAEAERALQAGYPASVGRPSAPAGAPAPLPSLKPARPHSAPIPDSYCVDASCRGNPGRLEYRCLHTTSRQMVFAEGPFERGTNNIGEFLAIVQALIHCQANGLKLPIYSDSENAILWVRVRRCKTMLEPDPRNRVLFERIHQAETWLRSNAYANSVLKWDTPQWGEIPADYGRK